LQRKKEEDKSACAQSGDDTKQYTDTRRLPKRVYKIYPPTHPSAGPPEFKQPTLVSLNCGAPKQYEKEKTNWAENHRFFLSGSFMKTANSLRFFFWGR
jgi:hypothetical protein